MKLRVTLTLLVIALLPAGFTLGQSTFTEFTGTETLAIPFPIEWGTVSCPGGQPTAPWPVIPPCAPGSRVHLRGVKWLYTVETTDPRLRGEEVVVMNGNFDGWRVFDPGPGQMWGTIRLEVKDGETKTGEVWEGIYTGVRTIVGDVPHSSFHVVAHGSGGRIEGLQAQWDLSYDPVSGVGYCKGRILAPGGK